MRIKIVSDGTWLRTRVFNADTGEEIENVVTVRWWMRSGDDVTAELEIADVEVELVGNAAVTHTSI